MAERQLMRHASDRLLALGGLFVLLCRLLTAWLDTGREGHVDGRSSLASYGLALQEGVFQPSGIMGEGMATARDRHY